MADKSFDLATRIKRYEASSCYLLPSRQPLVIRIDGRAFHTYTRGMDKPFDLNLTRVMLHAAEKTAQDMQGFKLAYQQSDEVTFLLTDYDRLSSRGWFNYELNKVVSLSASLFTAYFNDEMRAAWETGTLAYSPWRYKIATFDSRAFVVPQEDAPNVFVWRQRDWERNSVAMLAQAYFSHRELHQKSISDMHEMLYAKGINWAELPAREKNGTFILRDGAQKNEKADYITIANWIQPQEDCGSEEKEKKA